MFHTKTNRMFLQNAEGRDGPRVVLHNVDFNGEHPHQPEEAKSSSASASGSEACGSWGERDMGGPVNFQAALQDYEEMRRELTNLSRSRTNKTNRSGRSGRSVARAPKSSSRAPRESSAATQATAGTNADIEAFGDKRRVADVDEDDFELGGFLKDGHFEKRDQSGSAKKVGVVYKHLTVKGVGATSTFVRTLPHAVIGVSTPEYPNLTNQC